MRNNLPKVAILLLVLFLVCFPKGGIKVGGIPLTWGYLLIFVFSVALLPSFILSLSSAPLRLGSSLVLLCLLPFQLLVIISFIVNGVDNFGFAISLLVSFVAFPFIFLILFPRVLNDVNIKFLFELVRRSIIFVSAYGIFLFFYRLAIGEFIEVPYLTVNFEDVGGLDEKHIDRGGIFKLISTYNNGNIYGVAVLMLLPLFDCLEKRGFYRYLVRISLVLTLSRTVWLGLILNEILFYLFVLKVPVRTLFESFLVNLFKFKITKNHLYYFIKVVFLIFSFSVALYYISLQIGAGVEFLFDRDLGGRVDQLTVLSQANWFPNRPFEQISEIVYLSVLESFGIFGLLFFVLAISSPLIVFFVSRFKESDSFVRATASGLILYMMLAFSDGAMLFIPILAFYWFLASLLLARFRL